MDEKRELLRHTIAALAYRVARALGGAPDDFAEFAGAGRTPVQILGHMGDLFDWALTAAVGQERWRTAQPLGWADEQSRFFTSLQAFDSYIASSAKIEASIDRLMQGPVVDAFTHVGQLAMLRRLSGSPTRGENFYVADVKPGNAGPDQPAPVQPFR